MTTTAPQQSVVDLFKQIAGNEFGFFGRLNSLTDVVNSEIPTTSCDDSFGRFVGRKDVRSIGSRGIVDPEDGHLIGVLKKSTVLRCYPRYLNTLAEKDEDEEIVNAQLSALVTRPAPSLAPTASIMEALDQFIQEDCDLIFVCEDPMELLGVVTPKDIAKTIVVYNQLYSPAKNLQRLRLIDLDEMQLDEIFCRGAQTARDFMQPMPTMDGGEPVLSAIRIMHDHQTTSVALFDESQAVSQVISLEDILVARKPPNDLRVFCQVADQTQSVAVGKLNLLPFDELCESRDPVIQEPASSLANTTFSEVQPTSRLREVLAQLVDSHQEHVILVKSGDQLEGAISIREILRIFKTMLRIQSWNR